MKLAIFDDFRLGVVSGDGTAIADVSAALPWPRDPDPLGAGWWVRLCRDFAELGPKIAAVAVTAPTRPLDAVRLRPPALNPSKVIACAVNYAAHAAEMQETVQARVGGATDAWMFEFDVFLKAPSSIVGPGEVVVLPRGPLVDGKEVHHESELTIVVGRGGARIAEADALGHVLGYTIGIDVTLRGQGDRSRRKSYDTFTPLGPWITTADEVPDPHALVVRLRLNGETRQDANTADLLVKIPGIITYASSIMRLEPGDLILTGAPLGVGQIRPGDVIEAEISGLGSIRNLVQGAE